METDSALRLRSGSHAISRSRLNEFRRRNGALFAACIEQTVALARAEGLLPLDDLAADSMRLRAHASTKAVRTASRSTKRRETRAGVDESRLSETDRAKHRERIEKHTCVVAECEARGRTSIVTTNPSAALMKFPDFAALPGHRISAMAAGRAAARTRRGRGALCGGEGAIRRHGAGDRRHERLRVARADFEANTERSVTDRCRG